MSLNPQALGHSNLYELTAGSRRTPGFFCLRRQNMSTNIFQILAQLIDWKHATINLNELKSFMDQNIGAIECAANKEHIIVQIMVKNQPKLIVDCIKSVSKYSDKIIVMDTGSTDNTLDVLNNLKQNNSKLVVISQKWADNFAQMRNLLLHYAEDDEWVLFIDSDEILKPIGFSKFDLKFILATLELFFTPEDISLQFKQIYPNRRSVSWPERMIKKTNSVYFWGFVHEEVRSTKKLHRIKTNLTVLNAGVTASEISRFNKQRRYYELSQQNIVKEPDNPKWTALEPYEIAIQEDDAYIRRVTRLLRKEDSSEYRQILLQRLINYDLQIHNIPEAERIIEKSEKKYPQNSIFIFDKYYLHIILSQQDSAHQLQQLRKDLQGLDEMADPWSSYQSLDGIQEVIIKLLLQIGDYQHSLRLLENYSKENIGAKILTPELKWLTRENNHD